MKGIKKFLKVPETYIGIVIAIAFQLIFFCVWMTAYDGVNDRTNQLKIGMVNEDQQQGPTIVENIKSNVPFTFKTYETLKAAKMAMNERDLDMVIFIPSDFTQTLQEKSSGQIRYYINQSNASLSKQIMEGAAKQITLEVNNGVFMAQQQIMTEKLQENIAKNLPSPQMAAAIGENITSVLGKIKPDIVDASITKVNNVDSFSANMIPMMIVLASFVGAIIMTLQMQTASGKVVVSEGKWSVFFARQIIQLLASMILSLITIGLMRGFDVNVTTTFWESWTFQTLVFWSFILLTQMFVLLFGNAGMLFNILALSFQLVSSGVIVPRAMLSDFYHGVGNYLPATYAAEGYFTIVFGGAKITNDIKVIGIMVVCMIAITSVGVLIRRNKQVEAQVTAKMG